MSTDEEKRLGKRVLELTEENRQLKAKLEHAFNWAKGNYQCVEALVKEQKNYDRS
jgi:hypothetical protein